MMPVVYNPKATAPLFQAFLMQVMPDAEKRLFLQRYSGYALTGDVGEQCLLLNYGTGANGKSTYMDLMRQLFGALAMAMDFSSLEHNDNKRGGDATPDLIDLPGKRLVMASEPKPGVKLSEGLIKSLTGGDPIKARQLNQPFIEFYPQFKLMLAFNTKPTITGTDNGIWRRMMLLDWSVTIPKDQRDKHLKEKLMAEGPGILNWLLDGWRMWREKGLSPPESVAAATSAWREESDRMGAFIEACCDLGEGKSIGAAKLYKAYERWCKENAVDAASQTMFGKLFPERAAEFKVAKLKTAGIITYRGVDVKYEWDGERDQGG
jgi:putative DNA primase/helicase